MSTLREGALKGTTAYETVAANIAPAVGHFDSFLSVTSEAQIKAHGRIARARLEERNKDKYEGK